MACETWIAGITIGVSVADVPAAAVAPLLEALRDLPGAWGVEGPDTAGTVVVLFTETTATAAQLRQRVAAVVRGRLAREAS